MAGTHRAQVAVEFITYFGFFLAAFTIVLAVLTQQQLAELHTRQSMVAKETVQTFAAEIDTAVATGPGYSKKVLVPRALFGGNYEMGARSGFAYLNTSGPGEGFDFKVPLATDAVCPGSLSFDQCVPQNCVGVTQFPINPAAGFVIVEQAQNGLTYVCS